MARERRRSKRYKLNTSFRFRIFLPSRPETVSPWLSAQLYDISEMGMRFLTDTVQSEGLHFFHPNTTTSEQGLLEIEIPSGDQTLTMRGRVVWYDRTPEDSAMTFQAGVEFEEMSRDLRKQIRDFIQEIIASADTAS